MADLALYAAQANGAGFYVRTEQFRQRAEFHGVAHAGTGTVRFNQAHGFGRVIQLFKGFFHRQFLTFGVGSGDAFAFPVGRSTDGADNGVNLVAGFYRIGQTFQNYHTGAFGHYEAVGTRIKRIGPRFGQSANFAELNVRRGRHHLVHTACNGHVKVTHAKPVYGLVNGRQRSGASSVHREVGAVQVKYVGDAAGDNVGQFAGHGVFVNGGEFFTHARVHFVQHFLGVGRGQRFEGRGVFQNFIQERAVEARVGHFVFHAAHRVTNDDRRAVMVKLFFIVTGIFQRHAGGFNGQMLDRVHLLGNLRRNAVF